MDAILTNMTIETARIADQLRRSCSGPAWHGPSLSELLEGVTEELAARRAVAGGHTIHELVLHITAWMRAARERLTATAPIDLTLEEDWPPADGPWSAALANLGSEARALEEAVLLFPDERLDRRAPAHQPQSYYGLLHGVIQHNLYHAGQIALLRK